MKKIIIVFIVTVCFCIINNNTYAVQIQQLNTKKIFSTTQNTENNPPKIYRDYLLKATLAFSSISFYAILWSLIAVALMDYISLSIFLLAAIWAELIIAIGFTFFLVFAVLFAYHFFKYKIEN